MASGLLGEVFATQALHVDRTAQTISLGEPTTVVVLDPSLGTA